MANLSTRISNDSINRSAFQLYSMGIVANNKQLNSRFIEAIPIEDAMGLSGELTDHIYKYKSQGVNAYGQTYQTEIKTTASIMCEWLGMGDSNRMTAPDVRRGELVRIYRVADSKKFYWDTAGTAFTERRLETVVHAYSGTKEENVPLDESNCYVSEVNTHKGLVRLIHTSMANEEPYGYDIMVNTKEGQVIIKDNIGNMILLTSKDHHILLVNKDKTLVELKKKDINMVAEKTITMTAKNLVVDANTTMNGNTDVTGTLTGGVVKQGTVVLGTHTHTGRGSGIPNR